MKRNHTFVICAYKNSPYLETCIQSLRKQTVKSEILMSTSTPNLQIEELCRKYHIPLFINKGDTGIAQDWNFGYSCAQTEYVTIAHQDDVYFPEYVEMVIKTAEKEKKPLIIFSDYYELRNGRYVKNSRLLQIKRLLLSPLRVRLFWRSRFIRRRILSLGSAICCPSVTMCRKNLPAQIFRPHFKSNVDWEAWINLSHMKGSFVYINRALMAHRIHEDSETSAVIGDNGRTAEDLEIFRKFWPNPVAKLLARIYSGGEKYNKVTREK